MTQKVDKEVEVGVERSMGIKEQSVVSFRGKQTQHGKFKERNLEMPEI